jgi:hypothetical protein
MSEAQAVTLTSEARGAPPTLAMSQLIATGGTYPARSGGPTINTLAMVHSFAGTYGAFGAAKCD